jgi:hypothetical protein
MANGAEPKRAKKLAPLIIKLISGIAALTAAYAGYARLENQNALMLQALGSKLNSLSEQVAYLQGMHGIPPDGSLIDGEPAHKHTMSKPSEIAALHGEEPPLSAVAPVLVRPAMSRIKIKAFEQVPVTFDGLQALEQTQLSPKGE